MRHKVVLISQMKYKNHTEAGSEITVTGLWFCAARYLIAHHDRSPPQTEQMKSQMRKWRGVSNRRLLCEHLIWNARGEAANPANLSLVLVWSSPRKWSASIKKIRVPSRVVQVFISAWCSQGMETHSLNKQLTQCATWLVQSFSHCGIFTSEHRRVDGKQKTLRNHDKLRKCDKWQAASGRQHDNVLSNIQMSFWLEEREENIDQWVLVKGSLVSHGVLYLILQSNDSLCSSVFIIPSFTKASNQSNN